jgi:DNA protecting protein DprA
MSKTNSVKPEQPSGIQGELFNPTTDSQEVANPPISNTNSSAVNTTSEKNRADHIRVVDDDVVPSLLEAILALASVKGFGLKTLYALFDADILLNLWLLTPAELREKFEGVISKNRQDLVQQVIDKLPHLRDVGRRGCDVLLSKGIQFVPLGHVTYPDTLRRLQDAPRWIFVKGNLQAIHSEATVAVVGTRGASRTGLKLAYRCAEELARRNITVLSGLAQGIDESAHLGALDNYGLTVAVLGYGINLEITSHSANTWSRIVNTEGAIVSEYLPNELPSRQGFLRRNELQVAMAQVLIPIECPSLESGTGATIRRAINLGTPVVGVVPTNTSEHSLISTRTNLVKSGCTVFSLTDGGAVDFWAYLIRLINPTINSDPSARQDRFFRIVEKQILQTKDKLDLDAQAIDRLAVELKQKLS